MAVLRCDSITRHELPFFMSCLEPGTRESEKRIVSCVCNSYFKNKFIIYDLNINI